MKISKNSFFNAPLLVALLITSVIHFMLIFLWLNREVAKVQKNHAVVINLIKIPTQHPLKQPLLANPPPAPLIKPMVEKPIEIVEKKIKAKETTANLAKPLAVQKQLKPLQPAVEVVVAPEFIPVVEEVPVISKPEPPVTVETTPVLAEIPANPVEKETVVLEKPMDLPKKSADAVAQKHVKEQLQTDPASSDHPPPELSMDDLALQIAQVGEKFGGLSAETEEKSPKKAPTNNSRVLINQYILDCRNKVQRIGNLNYPKSAWQNGVSARTVIAVRINSEGGIQSLRIKKSSGDAAIDAAAREIVQMSAPFPVFPGDLAQERDELNVQFPLRFSDEFGVLAQ